MSSDMTYCQGNGCTVTSECQRYLKKPKFIYTYYYDKTPGKDETCPQYKVK